MTHIINQIALYLINATKTQSSTMSGKPAAYGILGISRAHGTGLRVKNCPVGPSPLATPSCADTGSALCRTQSTTSLSIPESDVSCIQDPETGALSPGGDGPATRNTEGTEKGKENTHNTQATAATKRRHQCVYRSGCCGTLLFTSKRPQKLEELPEGSTLVVKDWRRKELTRKEDGSPFVSYDLIDITRGVWYRTSTFTKWREEVDDSASPDID